MTLRLLQWRHRHHLLGPAEISLRMQEQRKIRLINLHQMRPLAQDEQLLSRSQSTRRRFVALALHTHGYASCKRDTRMDIHTSVGSSTHSKDLEPRPTCTAVLGSSITGGSLVSCRGAMTRRVGGVASAVWLPSVRILMVVRLPLPGRRGLLHARARHGRAALP